MPRRLVNRRSFHAALLAAAAFGVTVPAHAQFSRGDRGYVGPAYLQIPGIKGDARDPAHKKWVRIAAHYWKSNAPVMRRGAQAAQAGQANASAATPATAQRAQAAQQASAQAQGGGGLARLRTSMTVPGAPRSGEGTLVLAIDKNSPALKELMARCGAGTAMPEVAYSVSSERSRSYPQFGPRPASMPEWFDFKLKNVQFTDCPTVEGAPDQAIVVKFSDIEWLNWTDQATVVPVTFQPAALASKPGLSGQTRSWVVTWFAMANDVSDDQCPKLSEKPTEADYYAQMSKEEADKERAALAGQGGPNYENGQMGLRGPRRLNVTILPGVVPDPGIPEPKPGIARGLNLDGDDGTKRKHRNYASADGKVTGIDNQYYTVTGCIPGWQGHKGFILQFANNQMRDGQMSILLEVSGIDDERNDDQVIASLYYSLDPMAKSGSGAQVLSDYSFSPTANPEYSHYFARIPGRIVDGVLVTDSVESFALNLGQYGTPTELKLQQARLRIELKSDGTIKGVLGGYRDWQEIASTNQASSSEFYHGFQQPALYNALKRNADGMKDPVTGEYNGISSAYDIEGVPAFVMTTPERIASAEGGE